MTKVYRAGILGATGTVGQRFIELLQYHKQFEVVAVAASENSQGKRFRDACVWRLAGEMPERVRDLIVQPPRPALDCDVIFSSLPGDMARESEAAFRVAGYKVISNSSAFRMDADVPLVIPEVNSQHLALIDKQLSDYKGFIVTNPNCSTIMLALALAPLHEQFGLEAVAVTTLQAISGAGYPGVASFDILDNVVPFISGEEEKIEAETKKILGALTQDKANIEAADLAISAQCTRVPVIDGHFATVRVKLKTKASVEQVRDCLSSFTGEPQKLKLASAPKRAIITRSEADRPQTRLDRDAGNGMSVTVGRIKTDNVLDFRFVCLSHNTIRGAAGGALLIAEMLAAMNRL